MGRKKKNLKEKREKKKKIEEYSKIIKKFKKHREEDGLFMEKFYFKNYFTRRKFIKYDQVYDLIISIFGSTDNFEKLIYTMYPSYYGEDTITQQVDELVYELIKNNILKEFNEVNTNLEKQFSTENYEYYQKHNSIKETIKLHKKIKNINNDNPIEFIDYDIIKFNIDWNTIINGGGGKDPIQYYKFGSDPYQFYNLLSFNLFEKKGDDYDITFTKQDKKINNNKEKIIKLMNYYILLKMISMFRGNYRKEDECDEVLTEISTWKKICHYKQYEEIVDKLKLNNENDFNKIKNKLDQKKTTI